MKKIYLFLLLTAISFSSFAQTAASYAFSRSTTTYTSISGNSGITRVNTGGTFGLGIEDDDAIVTGIPIGFTFNFCGTNYTTLEANSNGWISFGTSTYFNDNIPSSFNIQSGGFIFPFWFDLDGGYGVSSAYYQTTGTVGSRVFTLEFKNYDIWSSTYPPAPGYNMNFQVKLFEGTNIIQFIYGSAVNSPTTGGIGIANSTSDYQYLFTTTSTTTTTTGSTFSRCSLPSANTLMQFCPNAPVPTGSAPVCAGGTMTLTDAAGAGSWTSSNTAIATVGSASGVVTGVSGGTATITYSSGCLIPSTTVVTINALPATPSGSVPFCTGSSITLTDVAGTWTSGNTSIATIGSSTGVVTGVSAGTAPITFTATSTGCVNTSAIVTVNSLPATILGTTNVCVGGSTKLVDVTSGGTWSSGSTLVATVNPFSGAVTGLSAGTVAISYTASGCSTSTTVTVNGNPPAITGSFVVCPASTITLGDPTTGGTWTSGNMALATVGSMSGTVTGVSGGNPVITYTLGTGCFTTQTITVSAISPITGELGVCTTGGTVTLSDLTSVGTWSSSNPAVATIGSSSGVVTPLSVGTTVISYSVPALGCVTTAVFGVTAPPNVYTVTGGGGYCTGGAGVTVGLSGSDLGVSYQLFSGGSPFGSPVSGTGAAISFAPIFTAGTYTVVANQGSSCATNMTGSATVTVNSFPTVFTLTGGGAYCSGGTGVHVGLSSSTIGVNYQLYNGPTAIGTPVAGTGAVLDFGLETTAGLYTAIATNATTGCSSSMSGTSTISINSLPTVYSVTGGGSYCTGGTGVTVGVSSSQLGVNYQLYRGGVAVSGAVVSGTGLAISFGLQTVSGTYTVVATNASTSCSSSMSGSVIVSINPLPTVFTITGGGAYCSGGTGVHIGLNSSTVGVNYQLYLGTSTIGSPLAGTGVALDFGAFTTSGSYTVVATNATTGCTMNMSGSVSVTINPLPSLFSVTGGGAYCAGGSGVHVGVSGSQLGMTYQLYNGTTLWDATAGTGSPIDFGFETAAGFYTVVAVNNTTGCTATMTGGVTVTINSLPVIFTVTGGGSYCSGGTGVHVGLNGSTLGVNYQLYNGTTPSGAVVAGTGVALDFGVRTAAGSYTAVATNATTGCVNNMTGSASIVVNPLPPVFTLTGTPGYCSGGTGTHIGLSGSNLGYTYQLNLAGSMSGSPVAGTGFPIDFGLRTVPGTYKVIASNTTTGCSDTMTGSLTVVINPLPTAHVVTGGGGYCAGSTGVHIGLNTSDTGIKYQLFNGTTAVGSPVSGTGSALDMGAQTAVGTYTIVATNNTTGCTNNMSGSVAVSINALPAAFNVTGGGGYCTGGTGVHIGLSASTSGISYQLFNGTTPTGLPVAGTGALLDFGLQTAAGTYTVVATNNTTSCSKTMTGSATVTVNALPNAYLVTGGGNYCFGTTGVHIGMATTDASVNYQLMLGTSPVGAPVAGTGGSIDFGLQTAVGTYSVVATNLSTGCTRNMAGTPVVNINTLPVAQTVTGGGSYCPGGTGVDVGLASSEVGINYQLYNGTSPVGAFVTGAGGSVDFGLQTAAGTYTVRATNPSTTCTAGMTGSVTVAISPLPNAYNVTGTGNYCPGGSGLVVGLSGSDIGTTYQLYNTFGTVGIPVAGTGIAISFGNQPAGTYTVVATNTTTTCTNNMTGSAVINVKPLPNMYVVTGGGAYCAGGAGVDVGLSSSDTGIHYQLLLGSSPVGTPMAGTGAALDFGSQTGAGTYTIVALSSPTTCSGNMTGSAVVNINAVPVAYNVTGGGGYCTGGTGVHVTLSGSTTGIRYQLMRGTTPAGTYVVGSGAMLDFGLQTVAGTYTVQATNTVSGCTNMMTGSVSVVINALPIAYTVSGGGSYCAGGTGKHVMLSGSNTGVSYQLYDNAVPTGTPLAGTGFGLDFGLQTAAGNYTVRATNATTGCVNTMTGYATITINSLPHVYPVSSTTSNYCIGGSGVDIYLNSSDTGVSYQLYFGVAPAGSPVAGTGGVVDFGYQLAAGTYTAVATNTTTSCQSNMTSSVTVVIDALPIAYNVTGGGGYCSGTSGTHVGLSGSNVGLTYQLYVDGTPTGSPLNGTGSALDFGLQTTTGTYSVIATNTLTTCTNVMSGSVAVAINSLPAVYVVTGGGDYCATGTGVHIGIGGSQVGVSYQLYNGTILSGSPVIGGGGPVDFGLVTGAGTYNVVATNLGTSCSSNMLGTAAVTIDPLPTAYPVIGGGNYCSGGVGVHVGLAGSHAGVSYQLFVGTTPVGSPMTSSGPAIDFGLQTAAGTYTVVGTNVATTCSGNMSGSAAVAINPLPTSFTVTGGGAYCAGTGGVHVGLNGSQPGVSYQLLNGVVPVGGTVSGTGGILDFGLITTAATYTAVATNTSTTCTNSMAGTTTVSINPTAPAIVNIVTTSGDTLCSGDFTTFTAVPTNGGTTPIYQWSVNGVVTGLSNPFAYIPADGDVLSVSMTSNALCASPLVATKTMTLNVEAKGTPAVSIAAYPGNEVCQGSVVHLAATPSYGGSTPTYQWIVNGATRGSAANLSYTPANGDIIYAVMNSNYHCRLADMATSNHIEMIVDVATTPTVTVTASPGLNIYAGMPAVFTAVVSGGGMSPTYQWFVNSSPVPGATNQTYTTSTLNDLDIVSCQVTSGGGCAGLTSSGSVTVHVTNVGVQQVSANVGDIKLMPNPSKGTFVIKGSLGTTTDEQVVVEVTDMVGQVVYKGNMLAHNGDVNEHIQLGSVANGMYVLSLHSSAGNMIFHLVIEQ